MPNSTTNYSFNLPLVNNATDADLWGGQLNSNWTSLDSLLLTSTNAGTPIGSVFQFAGTSAPSLHQLCYGQTIGDVGSGADVENANYETVFDIVKNAYGNAGTEVFGSGDTVLMPDCRGRVAAGQDDMGGSSANRLTNQSGGVDGDALGDTGGSETHTLTTAQVPDLNIDANYWNSASAPSGANHDDTSRVSGGIGGGLSPRVNTTVTGATNGGGGAHNNVQPTIIFNTIMFMGA